MSDAMPAHLPIPLADVEVAERLARGLRRGATFSVPELLAAFGAPEDTPDVRSRIQVALLIAGLRPSTDLPEATGRVTLTRNGRGRRWPWVVAALVLLLMLAGALLLGVQAGESVDERPVEVTSLPTGGGRPALVPGPAQAAPEADRETHSAGKAQKPTPRARPRRVRILLTARRPTSLCVDGGPGTRTRFAGTLRGGRAFEGRRLRIAVGRGATTRLRVGARRRIALRTSPAGFDLRPGRARRLSVAASPTCRG